ncbi:MAG TPA: phosphoribosylanthranilate isomerase [Blastocatellia bacterium]|nr:phosphoribosylanthranilate isomerase [Blastocatellia bacterium]
MAQVKVKICGIRSLKEAEAALDAGADALGFNFWPQSPRYIDPEAASEVISGLAPMVSTVGVFVNEEPTRILDLASALRLSAVQLHGDESPEFCERLTGIKTIKAIRVGQDFDLGLIGAFPVTMVLLDSNIAGSYGGTGQRFDWRIAIEAKRLAQIILAGGLTTENVWDAITHVRPAAIDVCSGVEAAPGRKDLKRLRDFMAIVAQANALLASESEARQSSIGFLP